MDIALAVEKLLGVADYGTATTYADLQRTWRDARPIPTMEQLESSWEIVGNNINIMQQITQLESTITLRRQREAILGTDNGWLANIDAQIANLREQLK